MKQFKNKFIETKYRFYQWLDNVSDATETFFKGMFSALLVILILLAVLCFIPFFAVWAINTLLEQGGFVQHINHGFFSYLAIYVLIIIYMLINKAME